MPQLRPSLAALSEPFRWLLHLVIGGRDVYLSTRGPATVTAADGTVREFLTGYGLGDYSRSVDLWSVSSSPRSQAFETLLDFDLALMVSRGAPLFAATGELSQWYEGTTWEQRRVVLRGFLIEPAYGAVDEPFAFSITEDPSDDREVVPPASWLIEEGVTFIEAGNLGPDPGVVGQSYPLIIGAPGQALATGTTSPAYSDDVAGSPALLVQRDGTKVSATLTQYDVLIAGGRVGASSVKIINLTDTARVFTATPLAGVDALGQAYTYVNPTIGNIPFEGDELFAVWDPASGGGMRNPFGKGPLRSAGDVIRWALQASSIRVDNSRLGELSVLDAFKIDTYINTPVSPWAWLQSEVLPVLPVTVGTGPDGIFVVPWLARAVVAEQAVAILEDGRNVTRRSGLVYTAVGDVYNEITLRYAPNVATGAFAGRRTLGGYRYAADDPQTSPAYWCKRSQAIFGRRSFVIETSVIYDDATADAVVAHLARRYSHPRREVVFSAGRDLDWLRPGDVVLVTDASVSLAAVPAVVGSISYSDDALDIQVVIFEPLVFGQ